MVIPGLQGISLKRFAVAVGKCISRDGVPDLAAQLAYWGVLALFPFAIFLVTILGFLPIHGLADQLFSVGRQLMPHDVAQLFEDTVKGLIYQKRGVLLVAALGGGLWAASGGVSALITALDRAYGVEETRSWLRLKLSSIGITLVATVMIVIASAAMILGPDFGHRVSTWLHVGMVFDTVWRWARWPVMLVAMSAMLAFLYWACPNVKQKFKYLTPGSFVGVVLWVVASLGFNAYASSLGNYNKTYGALAGGVTLLTWMWLSAFIVIVGGVMNAVIWVASHPGEHLNSTLQSALDADGDGSSVAPPPVPPRPPSDRELDRTIERQLAAEDRLYGQAPSATRH